MGLEHRAQVTPNLLMKDFYRSLYVLLIITHQRVVINASIINNRLTSLDSSFKVHASFVFSHPASEIYLERKRGSETVSKVVRSSYGTRDSRYSISEVIR